MAIELTPEEQAKLNVRNQKELALNEWKKELAKNMADLKIQKTGARRPATIKKIKLKSARKAKNLIKSVDKGFSF
jgi:hypothetical protein